MILVTISGEKSGLQKFEKTAYKNDLEEFCIEQLLPFPNYIFGEELFIENGSGYNTIERLQKDDGVEDYKSVVYNKTRFDKEKTTRSILVRKSGSELVYFCNNVSLVAFEYLPLKYANLDFDITFWETKEYPHSICNKRCGLVEIKQGARIRDINITWDEDCTEWDNSNDDEPPVLKMDWQIPVKEDTYLFMADFELKLKTLLNKRPDIIMELTDSEGDYQHSFSQHIDLNGFLKKHEDYYFKALKKELEIMDLMYQDITDPYINGYESHHKHERFNGLLARLHWFANLYFKGGSKMKRSLNLLTNFQNSHAPGEKARNRSWWNRLSKHWQKAFIDNLRRYNPTFKQQTHDALSKQVEVHDAILDQVIGIRKLNIFHKELIFNLSPLLYLKNLEEFRIPEPDYHRKNPGFFFNQISRDISLPLNHGNLIPNSIFKTVYRLYYRSIDSPALEKLQDFPNLKFLFMHDSELESLKGIEKLSQLEYFRASGLNHFYNLQPLTNLPLKHLNISYSNVTDIQPLKNIKTLETLNLSNTEIEDLTPLLSLPKLISVILPDGTKIQGGNLLNKIRMYLDSKEVRDYFKQIEPREKLYGPNRAGDFANSSWYYVPDHPRGFDENLSKGTVLFDRYGMVDDYNQELPYRISIYDTIGIMKKFLSGKVFYAVTPLDDFYHHPKYRSKHFGFCFKVRINEVLTFEDFWIRHSPIDKYTDSVNINDNILFDGMTFPKLMRSLEFDKCNFNRAIIWPEEVSKDLVFRDCTFKALQLPRAIAELKFSNCKTRQRLEFSGEYETISFTNIQLTKDFVFPSPFRGNLQFEDCTFHEDFLFPQVINGNLAITNPRVSKSINIPQAGSYSIKLKDESVLKKIIAPATAISQITIGNPTPTNPDEDLPF